MDAGAEGFSFKGTMNATSCNEGRTILTATRSNGLYTVERSCGESANKALVTVQQGDSRTRADLWHRRYGHLGYGALSRLTAIIRWWMDSMSQQKISRRPALQHASHALWGSTIDSRFQRQRLSLQNGWSYYTWMCVDRSRRHQWQAIGMWQPSSTTTATTQSLFRS